MIKNWQHLCIFGRLAAAHNKIDGMLIEHNGKELIVDASDDIVVKYIDKNTGEIHVIQGEDGFPEYTSDWANARPIGPYQIA